MNTKAELTKSYLESLYKEPYLNIAKSQVLSYVYKNANSHLSNLEEVMDKLTIDDLADIIDFSGVE